MVTGSPRSPARWVAETSRHSAAQPAPCRVARKVTRGSRGSRNAPPRDRGPCGRQPTRREPVEPGRRSSPVGAIARSTPSTGRIPAAQAGLGELHRAVGAVAVGQRQGVHLLLGGPLDEHVRVGGAVLQRVAGRHVQVDEGVRHSPSPAATAPPGPGQLRSDGHVAGQPERLLDQREETVGVADQVVGLALGDRPARAGLGGGPLGGAGGEERRPLGELGRHLGEQHPGVLLAGRPRRRPSAVGPGGEQRGGRPQRGDVGSGVARAAPRWW